MKELIAIQKELKAPKGQYNLFGKYKYRSAEDILEAVKPLCHQNGCYLVLTDRLECVDGWHYVKAVARLTNADGEVVETTAYAREDENKKGMDGSQITGTASSYARKYALNGLFCIDDTKDADTDECAKRSQAKKEKRPDPSMEETQDLSYREKVIITAEERGISFAELAKDYGLNGSTTEERFKEVLEDMTK